MKIKVSDTTENQLNYLVAKYEGHQSRCPWLLEQKGYVAWQSYEAAWGNSIPKYSTDPSKSWFIIDCEKINIYWIGNVCKADIPGTQISMSGPTSLIAAMRCHVASKMGEEVEIPDNLI